MSLGADLILPKLPSVQSEPGRRGAPQDAGQGGFSGLYAQAREGAAESSPAAVVSGQAAPAQSAEEQTLAAVGNGLPPEEELLLEAPEDVSLEDLMLFTDQGEPEPATGEAAPAPLVADVKPGADALAMDEGSDQQGIVQNDDANGAAQALGAPLSAAASTSAAATPAPAAEMAMAGSRPVDPNAAIARRTERQADLADDSLAVEEGELEVRPRGESERDFSQLLRSSVAAGGAGAQAQAGADTPDSPVNPLTQAVQQAAAQREAAATNPQQPLNMRHPGLSEAVVERVMWLSSQNLRSAEIQLDPAELGRLEIRIDLNRDHAQISFASPHASVREALEGQMHRLREMFAQQGLDQLDVNVSDQSHGERRAEERAAGGMAIAGADADEGLDEENLIATTPLDSGRGLVDFYA